MLLVQGLEPGGVAARRQVALGAQAQQLFGKLRDQLGHELAFGLGQAHVLVRMVKAQHQLVTQQVQLFFERAQFLRVFALVVGVNRLPARQPGALGPDPCLQPLEQFPRTFQGRFTHDLLLAKPGIENSRHSKRYAQTLLENQRQ
ncbi:hypothetical protein D3C72_1800710 [compost metagenome]